ncbi:MAG: 50S ribosomal protein L15 [Candidatus Firestonebacteria bacterium]
MKLNKLKPSEGSRKRKKRLGLGIGSGHGKTSTFGNKGQRARSRSNKVGFEGGQMPLLKRTPKRGFTNPFKKIYGIINVDDLNIFDDGTLITLKLLKERGMIAGKYKKYKILGDGELKKKLIVSANYMSKKAIDSIKALGGEVK